MLNQQNYKIFISHATTDKTTIALPLYTQLKAHKLNPWIDKEDIQQSDSIFRTINSGLANASYAVAVISSSFMQSEWTNRELESIFNLMVEKKIIRLFVIYHKIPRGEVVYTYPLLADNLAFDSSDGVEYIAKQIGAIVLTKSELKTLIEGKEYSTENLENLPTVEESFYMIMNLQYEVEKVDNPFLKETVKRLSSKEREDMMRLLAQTLIQDNERYAKLYSDIKQRIPHRGGDDEVLVDLSLIGDDVLVGLLESSLN